MINGAVDLRRAAECYRRAAEAGLDWGEYNFANNHIKLAGDIPPLSQVNGKLAFSNHELHAAPLTAEGSLLARSGRSSG